MERSPKFEVVNDNESIEMAESIERAKELQEKLLEYNNADVVGKEVHTVEAYAHALTIELSGIPAHIRMQNGLPWHPMDDANRLVANDNEFRAQEVA